MPTRLRSRALALLTALVGLLIALQMTAHASVPTTYCSGHSYTYIVKNYYRGSAARPLRCGTTSWGFNHIKGRWNSAFDANIALTISRGESVADYQQDGGSRIYALFNNYCNELFRVIYNGGAYNGYGVRPQGIITAYYITNSAIATSPGVNAVTPDGKDAPANRTVLTRDRTDTAQYRTDCPVYQGI